MLAETMNLFAKPEVVWFIVGILLMIGEVMLPGLVVIFFGLGAIVTAICCMMFDLSINVQLVIFIVASVISLVLLRSFLKKIFLGKEAVQGADLPAGLVDYVGQKCKVTSRIDSELGGKVYLNGTEWKAASDKIIEEGEVVEVVGQDSITLIVREV